MSDYRISKIYASDRLAHQKTDLLLQEEGIRRDYHLDYTCGMYDDDMNVIATGSCFGNTIRCLAVSTKHQGEGLLNEIITHLIDVQFARGNTHLFLYTKCDTARFFSDLGFYEIVRVNEQIVFMENRRTGFADYLKQLESPGHTGLRTASLVMNANPFTNGHLYLVEKAASENDILHLFIVSEEASLVPFSVRKHLVLENTSHLTNLCYHDCGPYIISNATFPSYFQKDEESVIRSHALLDLAVFKDIAQTLHITRRYVGEEPASQVTNIYNQIMSEELPKAGMECIIIPRKTCGDAVISASTVRKAIHHKDWSTVKKLVPPGTYRYFTSTEAQSVIARIQGEGDVIHY